MSVKIYCDKHPNEINAVVSPRDKDMPTLSKIGHGGCYTKMHRG